jgi:hypothetical protein
MGGSWYDPPGQAVAGRCPVDSPDLQQSRWNLTADVKGRRLYELDRERLRRIDGMVALLHGPSLDDGVCMEIGYAASLGVPVVIVTTDFQTYGLAPDGPAAIFPDPLIELLAAKVVRVSRLGPSRETPADGRFEAYMYQNLTPVAEAADIAAEVLTAGAADLPVLAAEECAQPLAFLEPSPYTPTGIWAEIIDYLRSSGWKVHLAERLRVGGNIHEAALNDWEAIRHADLAVVDVAGPEAPPGAALVTGACSAAGRRVLATGHGCGWTFADGREPNWRNLMIQYAVHGRFTGIGEFACLANQR